MNHNQPPQKSAARGHGPLDWNLPITLAETEAIGRRLDIASDTDTLVETPDVQTMALCLSRLLGSDRSSPISRLADARSFDARVLRAECLAVHGSGELPPGLRRWAAWLIAYAAALAVDAGEVAMPTNGDALDVFLKLTDVTTQGDALLAEFRHAYCGSYADIDAAINGITDVLEWERKLRAVARELGCEEFVHMDRDVIAWYVRDAWDVIPSHGRLHVFVRQG